MTRKETLRDYDVDERGRICSPGKFEGEPIYAPHYWFLGLEGWSDRDDGKVMGFNISPEDRAEFPEIPKNRRTINLEESEQGFVYTDH
jgi:hypothetical protein